MANYELVKLKSVQNFKIETSSVQVDIWKRVGNLEIFNWVFQLISIKKAVETMVSDTIPL